MKEQKIDTKELFSMIVLFELGSAILFSLGADAKQDAWLAVFVGMMTGFLVFLLYAKLIEYTDYQTLTVSLRSLLGKYVGWLLGVTYVIYFIYISSRILRDFVTLLRLVAYENTSYLTIAIGIVLCVMYASVKGIEVFARFSMIIFYIVMSFLLIILLLLLADGQMQIQNLQPIMENGILPILKATYPVLATVPYGELVVFLVIFPFVSKTKEITKKGILAVVVGGGILTLFTVMNLLILGVDVYARSTFPLLTSISYVNIANFIQRIESILIIIMVLLGIIKIHIFTYAAMLSCSDLFQVRPKVLIYPVTFLVLMSSVFIASNHSEHIEEGLTLVPYYLHLPFQIIIPILLLTIAYIRHKKRAS